VAIVTFARTEWRDIAWASAAFLIRGLARTGQGPGTQTQQCSSLEGPSRRDHELQPGLCQGSGPLVRLLQTVKGVPPVEAVVGDEEAG